MIPFYETQMDKLKIIDNKRELFFPSHMHGNIEILYVYKGTQHICVGDVNYEVKEGELITIFPNIVHNYFKDNERFANGLLIICDPNIFLNLFPDLTNSFLANPVMKKDSIDDEMSFALNSLKEDRPFPIKLGLVYIIMAHILENTDVEKNAEVYSENIVKKIIDYIVINFTNPITIDSMAADLCVSKYYISHVFSEKIKLNFRTYLGMIRSEYASKLIRMTNASLTEISEAAGFESQRTFNRMFRLTYGCSPRDYKYRFMKK